MTITRTDLAELAVFAAVARHRSFSKAALELGVSASALSHSLKGLEARLGVRLLNRSTRAVVPTEAGQRLLKQLLPTLNTLEEALCELARNSDEPVGRLKLCAPRGAIDSLLAPVLIDYLARYPRMQVEVVEQELMPRLIEDGYDAALFYGDLLPKEMIGIPLGPPQRYLVVGSPAYLAEHGTPEHPSELSRHACIGYRLTPHHHYRWAFAADGTMLEIEVTGPLTTSTPPLSGRRRGGVGTGLLSGRGGEPEGRGGETAHRAGALVPYLCRLLPLLSQSASTGQRPAHPDRHAQGPLPKSRISE